MTLPLNVRRARSLSTEALAGSGAKRPLVVIFDDAGYEFFDQVAATLRRRGIGCVRVKDGGAWRRSAAPPSRTRALRDRLFYDATLALTRPGAKAWLTTGGHGRFRIVDVLISETMASSMKGDRSWLAALAGQGLAYAVLPPEVLLDKFSVNARLAAAGLRTPSQLRACDVGAETAARLLGLPLMVKARVSLGGDGVRIAGSVSEIRAAIAEYGAANQLFFQRFIPGETYGYGCLRGPEGPLMEHGFRMGARRWMHGPGLDFVLQDDPALLAAGRRVAEVLGCQGLAHFEFLRDADGRLWPIDANVRPWDEMSLLGLNIDYASAYADLLLGRLGEAGPIEAARSTAIGLDGRKAPIYPAALYAAARGVTPELRTLAAAFGRMCRGGPGAAYGAIVGLKAAALLARALGARLGRRSVRA